MGHPTLPGLVPLVALALIVGLYLPVVPGMSTHKRHQEKRDSECPQGKYKHPTNESICCLKCHKGTFLKANCGGPGLAPQCETCEADTFTEIENYFTECHPCSVCRKELGQILKKNCTVSSNTVCGCRENQYQQHQGEDKEFFRCVNCNPCLNGTIRHPCQEKQDTVCVCNTDFFWYNHKCIHCNECTPEKNCRDSCPLRSVNPKETVPVLMYVVIFLGFCCLSLIFIVLICHYPRWRSKLYVIVCGRPSPPVKEEEKERPLVSSHTLDSTPAPTPAFTSTAAPAPTSSSISSQVPAFPSTQSTSNWSTLHGGQPIVTLAPPHQQAEPIIPRTHIPSDYVTPDDTVIHLDKPAMLYAVVKEVPPSRWKEFIRRLGLSEHDIELIEMQNSRCLREAHYSMLATWQERVPRQRATLEAVAQVLNDMDLCGCLQNIQEAFRQGGPSAHLSALPR
ncbi:tumor necrosis factor receptor superfamily member 1A [Sminthopsis crassicaudata]|uniref:tumor necrosis factor receptor superfamily member 1A n=1 Tax=Sminthopsis crassicaudata TaxID=9301 RepID=UPI003D68C62C